MRENFQNIDSEKLEFVHKIFEDYKNNKIKLEDAKKIINEKFSTIKPYEIAIIEQEMKQFEEDECKKEDIQKMTDLFEDVMNLSRPNLDKDNPIMCYYRENDAIREVLLAIEDLVQYPIIKNQWYELYDKLDKIKIHFSRKQNQLYSVLEKKGFDRPTTTMWTLDDFIRDEINQARALLDADKEEEFIELQSVIVADIRDLFEKEEAILYPTSLSMLNDEEINNMKSGDREIGFALIDVDNDSSNTISNQTTASNNSGNLTNDLADLLKKYGVNVSSDKLQVTQGELTLDQVNLIYKHLPVDISYVDENEIVKFYSDTKHRIFPRSKNVIGRDVKNCHPRKSVHIVEEIVEKFRNGEQDYAEFWINKPDLFIYIYYVAVRDDDGKFRGVLEMMQDCTHIRSLQGSQTLLTWSSEKKEDNNVEEDNRDGIEKENIGELVIDENTKLTDMLAKYPWIKQELPNIHENFKMLNGPLARIMVKKANIKIMSERTGMDIRDLINKINQKIEEHK